MRDPVAERIHRRTMRRLIAAFAALAVTGGLAAGVGAAPALASAAAGYAATGASAAAATPALAAFAAIRRFAASLSAEQRAALAGPTGTGVRLADLSPGQRASVRALMTQLLSPDAHAVLIEAMAADDALAAAGTGEGSGGYRIGFVETEGSGFLQLAGPQLAVNALVHETGVVIEPELIQA